VAVVQANIRPYFLPVCEYIDKARKDRGKAARVLIHCQHGQSRSGALTVAYVMYSKKQTLRQAFELVAKARPCLKVNVSFIGQLQQLEKELFGTSRHAFVSLDFSLARNLSASLPLLSALLLAPLPLTGQRCLSKKRRSKAGRRPTSR
jgi:hypothetical protein